MCVFVSLVTFFALYIAQVSKYAFDERHAPFLNCFQTRHSVVVAATQVVINLKKAHRLVDKASH